LDWLQAIESVWPDWDAPPALHPDHPSAPFPRIDYALEGPPSGGRQLAVHMASGDRPQAVLTGPPRADDYFTPRPDPRREPRLPLWLAQRVLSEADDEAAAIRAAAQREAAEIRQQASDEAAALRAAAERDAAQMRAAVMTMSSELGEVAAYVTQTLTGPAAAALPARQREAQPATKVAARPRQYSAMRFLVAVVAALMLFAVAAGATEVGLHGFRFFVFRSAGTGATPSSGLNEDQGPGQPDAPKAHAHAPKAHAHAPKAHAHAQPGRPHARTHKPSASTGGGHG